LPLEPRPGVSPRASRFARLLRVVRGLGPAGPWLLVASAGPLLGLLILTATGTTWPPWFGDGVPSVLMFWALGALLAALCLVPSQATSLLAGYLFGARLGTLLGLLVVLVAALIGFVLWSRVVGSRVLAAIMRSQQAERVHRALLGRSVWRTTWLIALLRLSPVMPFAATNLLMAALGVRARVFVIATSIGVAPRSIAVSIIGAGLSELDWQAGDNVWITVIAVLATVLMVVLVSRYASDALRRE